MFTASISFYEILILPYFEGKSNKSMDVDIALFEVCYGWGELWIVASFIPHDLSVGCLGPINLMRGVCLYI